MASDSFSLLNSSLSISMAPSCTTSPYPGTVTSRISTLSNAPSSEPIFGSSGDLLMMAYLLMRFVSLVRGLSMMKMT